MQNRKLALVLFLIAYGLLYPGLTEPLLSITGKIDKKQMAIVGTDIITGDPQTPEIIASIATTLIEGMNISGTVEAYHKTRSILGTIKALYYNNLSLIHI